MTDVPTTALQLQDIAPDPHALTTSGTPTTITLGQRLYRITTGGTAGTEEIIVPVPDLPVGGVLNDRYLGLRVTFCLVTQTDPSDVVKISLDGGSNFNVLAPGSASFGAVADVLLGYVGAIVSMRWAADTWVLDFGMCDSGFHADFAPGNHPTLRGGTASDGSKLNLNLNGSGGDVIIQASNTDAGGLLKIQSLPTADPHVVNALWNNSGVLNVSAG